MSTTDAVLRQLLSEAIGDWEQTRTSGDQPLSTTTSGSTTTLVDTDLANLRGGGDTDFCISWFVLITESGHGSVDEVRRVSAYDSGTNTITVQSAFSATIGSGVQYELHRFDPRVKRRAINRGAELLYPHLYLPVRDQTLVVDDLLLNSDFETYSSGFTNWSNYGTPAVAQETGVVWHGSNSAKLTASGAEEGLYQELQVSSTPVDILVHSLSGRLVTFKRWVWATAGSEARLRLSFDGGTTFADSSVYHSGEDEWELLTAEANAPAAMTGVRAYCAVADGETGFFDGGNGAGLFILPINRYTLPDSLLGKPPARVGESYYELHPNGPFIPFGLGQKPRRGRMLQVEGMGLLSRPTTDSGTMEVEAPRTNLVVFRAAQWLSAFLSESISQQQVDRYELNERKWASRLATELAKPGMKMAPMGADRHRGSWHHERDGETDYLVFDRPRGY